MGWLDTNCLYNMGKAFATSKKYTEVIWLVIHIKYYHSDICLYVTPHSSFVNIVTVVMLSFCIIVHITLRVSHFTGKGAFINMKSSSPTLHIHFIVVAKTLQ